MTAEAGPAPEGAERDRVVRRNTILLALAQGFVYASAPVMLAAGTVSAQELGGREAAAGLMVAVYFLAAAGSALVTGRWMDRSGRRPGLLTGHALIASGGIAAAALVGVGSYAGLLGATAVVGAGAGAALLGRGAVADMYVPERRGRAVGLMLAASTVGAVAGAPLVAAVQRWADGAGVDRLVAPWFLVPLFEAAAIACVASVRPDPRALAVGGPQSVDAAPARRPRELLASPPFRAAIVSAGIGQAAMVAVMGVAPIVVHDYGHGDLAISGVLSAHFVGMFALMPLVGAGLDRFGRRRGLVAAAIVSAVGAPAGSLSTSPVVTGVGMFLVGVGWAGAYLGATTVVSDVTSPGERSGALGLTDLLVSMSSGTGALLGGVILEAGGFRTLTLLVAALFVPVLALVVPLREPHPGRWRTASAVA